MRRPTFEVPEPERFHPIYMANHAAVSYNFTGLGLYVALLEPFIVKSLRPWPKHLRSMLPGYSPHGYAVPDSVADLSARCTAMADSAT